MENGNYTRREFARLSLLAAGGALLPNALSTKAIAQSASIMRWGSSSLGSSAYVIFEALAQTVNKYTDMRNSSLATAGASENAVLIDRGELEFGSVTSADIFAAANGAAPFQSPIQLHQMFATTTFDLPLLVRADSGIHSYGDLARKRVMPSQPGSGANLMHSTIARAANVYDDIDWTYGSWNETYDAFRSGAVDAVPAILNNGRETPQVAQLRDSVDVRVLQMSDELFAGSRALNAGLFNKTVTPSDWSLLSESAKVPSFPGLVATSPSMSAETGYAVTKAIFDNAEEIRALASQTRDIEARFAASFLIEGYPVNAGAAQYFKEQGVWNDALTIAS